MACVGHWGRQPRTMSHFLHSDDNHCPDLDATSRDCGSRGTSGAGVHCTISKSLEVISTSGCNLQTQLLSIIKICHLDRGVAPRISKVHSRSQFPSRLCSMTASTLRPKALIPLYIYPLNNDTWTPLLDVYASRHSFTSEQRFRILTLSIASPLIPT
jgi:hypothetical protein